MAFTKGFSSRTTLRDVNNTTLELKQDLARSTPQQCVTLTHSVPSVQMYYALRLKLDSCSDRWLQEFLDLNGMDSLLDSLDQMSGRGFTCFSDAILLIDCISCIRCVLNTTLGLEYFINNDVYTKKLTIVLNSCDSLPKKQVFEMLSAICVYSNIGYLRVLEGLSYVKSECDQLHRFSLVVRDLKCETVAHKTAVMIFINALINSTPQVTERIRVRNEFIGVNILDMLSFIRKEEPDENLILQLEVFHERKLADEESVSANNNIDFNCPQDLQDQIQARVFGTSKMVNFVNILQDLLAIETVYPDNSVKMWQVVDDLIHHVTHAFNANNVDNSRQSEVHKLPEHLANALHCVASYEAIIKKLESVKSCSDDTLNSKNANVHNEVGKPSYKAGSNSSADDKQNDQDGDDVPSTDHKSKCNDGNQSANSNSDNDNSTQDQTVTGSNANTDAGMSGPQSRSENDDKSTRKPVKNAPHFCSPTDLTFFSNNMDDTLQSPPIPFIDVTTRDTANCNPHGSSDARNLSNGNVKTEPHHADTVHSNNNQNNINHTDQSRGNETENVRTPGNDNATDTGPSNSCHENDNAGNTGPSNSYHGDSNHGTTANHSSINSVLSKEGNGTNYITANASPTIDVAQSGQSSQCGMNINVSEGKAYKAYDQEKVGNNLGHGLSHSQTLGGNESKPAKCIDSMKSNSNDKCFTGGMVGETGGCRLGLTGSVKNEGLARKMSNTIERPCGPAPGNTMHAYKWITLQDHTIGGRDPCVWLSPLNNEDNIMVDYLSLDTAFQAADNGLSDAIEEIVLLDATTRLKINLFLSRMDSGAEDLIQNLEGCAAPGRLSLPMLQYLHKILPCQEEVDMLRQYKGPRLELGMAEQFVLLLSDMPDYSVLLDGHMMRAEFVSSTAQFKASLATMIDMAKLVLGSAELKQVLHHILAVGNYLNYWQFHGNAAGIKLESLERLSEVKCAGTATTLLSYIVQTCMDHKCLAFVKDFLKLEKSASISMEALKEGINKLNIKLRNFMNNLVQSSPKLQSMFQPFIESLKGEYVEIQSLTTELRTLTDDLANYFCEEETNFNLQSCFKTLISFCKQVNKCKQDLALTSKQHQQLIKKRSTDVLQQRLKSKLLALEFGQNAGASSSMMEVKTKLLEKVLTQLHQGNFNPCMKSEMPTPDGKDSHPLEMSCIPFEGSPARQRMGSLDNDSVFMDTPDLVCASYGSSTVGKMSRSSTQKLYPVIAKCTAQTRQTNTGSTNQNSDNNKPTYPPSPITGVAALQGRKSATLHRKLFPLIPSNTGEYEEREVIENRRDLLPMGPPGGVKYEEREVIEQEKRTVGKPRLQLELPSRKTARHRRSRSDMLDSICIADKWIEYEKNRDIDVNGAEKAPMAEPESACNLSTLNLENQGKFITHRDVAAATVRNVESGPVLRLPGDTDRNPRPRNDIVPILHQHDDRSKKTEKEKKSSVGGFFSKIGRAVLKPRNVYSDGDQDQNRRPDRDTGKSLNRDKENVNFEPEPFDDIATLRDSKKYPNKNGLRDSKRFGKDGNRDSKRFGKDGTRDSKRFGSDGTRDSKRFGSDGTRDSKRFGSDGTRDSKRFGSDGTRDSKRYKSDGTGNKVLGFFQRGGLYRSSKMKKKNQNAAPVE